MQAIKANVGGDRDRMRVGAWDPWSQIQQQYFLCRLELQPDAVFPRRLTTELALPETVQVEHPGRTEHIV